MKQLITFGIICLINLTSNAQFSLGPLFSSYGSFYQYPTSQSVNNFKKKGDMTITMNEDLLARFFNSGSSSRFSSQSLGFAFTNNIAFQTQFNSFNVLKKEDIIERQTFQDKYNEQNINNNSYIAAYKYKYQLEDYCWDNELIFFKQLANNIYPSLNIGIGFGAFDRNNNQFKVIFDRQYIQPAIAFSNDYFDIGISSKVSRIKHRLTINPEMQDDQVIELKEDYELSEVGSIGYYFLEPALTVGGGYKWLKFRSQYIYSINYFGGTISSVSDAINLSINATFNIATLKKGK